VSEQGEGVVAQGKQLIGEGQYHEAIELLQPWLSSNPDDASGWAALGAACFELEDWGGAERAAREVVRLRPDSAREWCNLGVVLRKRGEVQEAARMQRRALGLNPSYGRAHTELKKLDAMRGASRPTALPTHKRWPRAAIGALVVMPLLAVAIAVIVMTPRLPRHTRPRGAVGTGGEVATSSTTGGQSVELASPATTPSVRTEATTDTGQDAQAAARRKALAAMRRGKDLYAVGKYEEAQKEFESARALGSNSAPTWIASCNDRRTEGKSKGTRGQGRSPQPATQPSVGRLEVTDDDRISAILAARRYVKESLLSPSSARFSGNWLTGPGENVVAMGGAYEGCAKVFGWVEAQNAFGVYIRHHYTVILVKTGENTWFPWDVAL